MHLNSSLLFKKYAVPYFKSDLRVLEIGPAGDPSAYCKLVNDDSIQWDTLDFADSTFIGEASKRLTYNLQQPYEFPIEDNQYDIVVSGQVIEHVQNLTRWLREINRVVKNGGLVIIINPVSWPYHEAPLDCWRIYPSGMEALAVDLGFEVTKCLFESLEAVQILEMDKGARFIPGRSYDFEQSEDMLRRKISWNKFIRPIPFLRTLFVPIEVSYDTVSILKKL